MRRAEMARRRKNLSEKRNEEEKVRAKCHLKQFIGERPLTLHTRWTLSTDCSRSRPPSGAVELRRPRLLMAPPAKRARRPRKPTLPCRGGSAVQTAAESLCQKNGWVHLLDVSSAHLPFTLEKWLKRFDVTCRNYNGSALMEGFSTMVIGKRTTSFAGD